MNVMKNLIYGFNAQECSSGEIPIRDINKSIRPCLQTCHVTPEGALTTLFIVVLGTSPTDSARSGDE